MRLSSFYMYLLHLYFVIPESTYLSLGGKLTWILQKKDKQWFPNGLRTFVVLLGGKTNPVIYTQIMLCR